jgi:uncharacterized protein (TIGR02147 family)
MLVNIFDFNNYKTYLDRKFIQLSKTERGFRKTVAKHISCLPSYLSQVVNGKPNLTLEQAYKLNQLLAHDKLESKYFILLVEHERAGTRDLQNFFREQMNEIKQSRFDLKKRLKDTDHISTEDANKYYSTWYYTAIHMALAVPELQEPPAIARKFNLPLELVVEVISFLQECGLIIKEKNSYVFTKMRIHLDRNSDFIHRHHINWRSQSLQSVEKNLESDMHFSTVFAVSKSDYDQVREIFVAAIESARKVIRPSESEEVAAITFDLFKY